MISLGPRPVKAIASFHIDLPLRIEAHQVLIIKVEWYFQHSASSSWDSRLHFPSEAWTNILKIFQEYDSISDLWRKRHPCSPRI